MVIVAAPDDAKPVGENVTAPFELPAVLLVSVFAPLSVSPAFIGTVPSSILPLAFVSTTTNQPPPHLGSSPQAVSPLFFFPHSETGRSRLTASLRASMRSPSKSLAWPVRRVLRMKSRRLGA